MKCQESVWWSSWSLTLHYPCKEDSAAVLIVHFWFSPPTPSLHEPVLRLQWLVEPHGNWPRWGSARRNPPADRDHRQQCCKEVALCCVWCQVRLGAKERTEGLARRQHWECLTPWRKQRKEGREDEVETPSNSCAHGQLLIELYVFLLFLKPFTST